MGRFKEPDELKTSNITQKNNGESNKQIDNGKTHWKKIITSRIHLMENNKHALIEKVEV